MKKNNEILDVFFAQEQQELEACVLEKKEQEHKLVVFNDDQNTFDFVIECLIHICGHTAEQAEQCTMLIHYKGKSTVKTASLSVLKTMYNALVKKGLTADIV